MTVHLIEDALYVPAMRSPANHVTVSEFAQIAV